MAGRKSMVSKRPRLGSNNSKCSSPAPRWMMFAAFAILALLAATLAYQYMVASALARSTERFYSDAMPYTLVYLYMNGCGWCELFKPQWQEIETLRAAELAGMGVATAKFERSEAGAKAYASAVQGYPTILLVKPDGSTVKFDGDRTPDDVVEFVRRNVMASRESFFDGEQSFSSMGKAISNANAHGGNSADNVSSRSKKAGAKVG